MASRNSWLCLVMAVIMGHGLAASASATTLMRASLEELTVTNSTVVVGEVLDTNSYWNDDGTFSRLGH